MDFITGLFGSIFDKIEQIAFIIAPLAVAALFFIAFKLRKSGFAGNSPNSMYHEGYYAVAQKFGIQKDFEKLDKNIPGGYKVYSDSYTRFDNDKRYFYLRKDPFDVEVTAENITAADGNKYRALAVTTVYLPQEKIDTVIPQFYTALLTKRNCDAEIDKALQDVLADLLETVIADYDGTGTSEEYRKRFLAGATERTLIYGHLVSAVTTFSFVRIAENT